jgi:hypothetical protein
MRLIMYTPDGQDAAVVTVWPELQFAQSRRPVPGSLVQAFWGSLWELAGTSRIMPSCLAPRPP